jgi:uncharacterized membrane protein
MYDLDEDAPFIFNDRSITKVFTVLVIFSLILIPMFGNSAKATALAKFEPADGLTYMGVGTRVGEFNAFNIFVNDTGRYPALRLSFYSWGVDFPVNPNYNDSLTPIYQQGMIPVVTWEPFSVSLAAIANGSQDAYINSWAQSAKTFGQPMFLRFAHEMNGYWYPWGGDPAAYIAAWRHIYNVFQAAGATNVAFVWCPNWQSSGPGYMSYYPGDAYVDWVGVDLYNWPRWPRTFDFMVSNFYSDFSGRKPIMIGEVASAQNFAPDPGFENPAAQNKAQWITDMFNAMNTKYPAIKAYLWFNVLKETDWRVQSSPQSLAAFNAAIQNPRYLGRENLPIVIPTPTPTPIPPGYAISTSHQNATYGGYTKPIEQFVIMTGTTVSQGILFTNIGTQPDSYTTTVLGLPASWYTVNIPGNTVVQPGQSRSGWVNITPQTTGTYAFTVRQVSNAQPLVNGTQTYTLYVSAPPGIFGVSIVNQTATYNSQVRPIEDFNVLTNTTVNHKIYIRNTGNRSDTYNLSILGLPANWYTISLVGSSIVAPGDTRLVNVNITPKLAGIFSVQFIARSTGNPLVNVSNINALYVPHYPAPDVNYSVLMGNMSAVYQGVTKPLAAFNVNTGTTVKQQILVTNVGLKSDSYNMTVSGLPSSWYTLTMNGSATVSPNGQRNGSLFITPLAAGTYTFSIRAISNGDPQVYDFQEYTLHSVGVSPYGVTTTHRWATYNGTNAPIEQFNVKTGTTVSQSIYFTNTGSVPDSYNISISGIPPDWYSITLYGSATVAAGDSRYANAYITPSAAGNYTFTVKVASNGNPSVFSTQTYTLNVPPADYAVETASMWATYNGINAPIGQFSITPNTFVYQGIYLKNIGAKTDSYTVTVSGLPSAWYSIVMYGATQVAPGDVRYGNVSIKPTAVGNYTFTVKVTSNGNTSVYSTQTYTMHVKTVTPPPGYNVTTTHRWATYNGVSAPIEQFTVAVGTPVLQSIYFKNNGTNPDSYKVTVIGLPASWYKTTIYGATLVTPGDGRYGNTVITPTAAGYYTFTIRVTSNTSPLVYSDQTYTVHVA